MRCVNNLNERKKTRIFIYGSIIVWNGLKFGNGNEHVHILGHKTQIKTNSIQKKEANAGKSYIVK